jgi:hypothetical protein
MDKACRDWRDERFKTIISVSASPPFNCLMTLGGANLETIIAGGREPRIADRQSVSAAFAQCLDAALTAGNTAIK